MLKHYLKTNVFEESKKRIEWTFDNFEEIYISFSGGKDSTVMMHLVMQEAIKRNRKIGVFFVDWECQFTITIQHIETMFDMYKENIIPFWVAVPLLTDNACSMVEPIWQCWDEQKKELWVRDKPANCYSKKTDFPFYYEGMTFEEFTPLFSKWYSKGKRVANFVGIRSQESLNRFRTIARDIERFDNKPYTARINQDFDMWSIYPIYDWQTEDIWVYNAKHKAVYNKIYDLMYQSGLSIDQMRIDEPFGDTSRTGLWLYQIIEPQMWAKLIARVAGVNTVNEYGKRSGNILGNRNISLPDGHTWKSFALFILNTLPPKSQEHYKNKIAAYVAWYKDKGYPNDIDDDADIRVFDIVPSWKRVCKALLKNDWWCKTLGFSVNKSSNFDKYMELMKRKRNEWNIFSEHNKVMQDAS